MFGICKAAFGNVRSVLVIRFVVWWRKMLYGGEKERLWWWEHHAAGVFFASFGTGSLFKFDRIIKCEDGIKILDENLKQSQTQSQIWHASNHVLILEWSSQSLEICAGGWNLRCMLECLIINTFEFFGREIRLGWRFCFTRQGGDMNNCI